MPFNGSGTFTLVTGNPVVTGTVISSTVQNNTMADVANGLTGCVTRTGQSAALANLPMGGFKHTGAASGANTGEYLVYGQTGANLSSLTVGTLNTTGNANINGNVTLGDAATDVITVNGVLVQSNLVTFRAIRSGVQSSGQTVLFDSETFDNGGVYNPANGRFTVPTGAGGYYAFHAFLSVTNGGGVSAGIEVMLRINSLPNDARNTAYSVTIPAATTINVPISAMFSLAAGDYVSCDFTTGVLGSLVVNGSTSTGRSTFYGARIG